MADDPSPVMAAYEGEGVWRAANSFASKLADKEYVIGEVYAMVAREDRSPKTHKHEFAWLKTAWRNLPENLAEEYPTVEHLRKRALIQAGYYNEQIIDAGTSAAALRVLSALKSFPGEEFSYIFVRSGFVVVRRPKSQSRRSMDAKDFQESKTKILEIVSAMIGVPSDTLSQASHLENH